MAAKQTTIRIPLEINQQLQYLSDKLGFTRSDLIKSAILRYLVTDNLNGYEPIKVGSGEFVRTAVYLNDGVKALLEKRAAAQQAPLNSLILYAAGQLYVDYSKLITELGL